GRAEPGLLDDPRARLGDPAGPGAAVLLADRGDHGVPGPAVREGHRVPIGRGGVAADAAHLAGAAPELLTLQLAVGLEHGELGDLLDAQSVQGALLADTEAVELALAAHRDGAGRAPIDHRAPREHRRDVQAARAAADHAARRLVAAHHDRQRVPVVVVGC